MRQTLRWKLALILAGCGIATSRAADLPTLPPATAPVEPPVSVPFPSAVPLLSSFPSATAPAAPAPATAATPFPGTVINPTPPATPPPFPTTRPAVPTTLQAGASAQPGDTLISLNFPDGVPLKTLIDYVSVRLSINVLYDEQSVAKKLTIKAPAKIPESSLMGLLESALKMNELAIVDTDQKGWKRIVPAQNLVAISRAPDGTTNTGTGTGGPAGAGEAVTQVLTISHADINRVDQLIKPFLSGRGANTVVLPERGLLIVTDYASNMERIAQMVRLIDQPRAKVTVDFRPVKFVDAATLAQRATTLLASKLRSEAGGAGVAGAGGRPDRVEIQSEARTNQLILIGTPEDIEQANAIIASLDVAVNTQTKIYQFSTVSPERVDRLVKEFIGDVAAKTRYQAAVDKEGGILIVTATPDIHERIVALQKQLDTPTAQIHSPVQFYKLTNTTAADVLKTIQAIEGTEGPGVASLQAGPTTRPQGAGSGPAGGSAVPENLAAPTTPVSSNFSPIGNPLTMPAEAGKAAPIGVLAPQTIQTKQARITADPNTNTIIVIADPASQGVYEQLIHQLDKRRPQVLLECILITLDTSNGFSLGVEVSGKGMGSSQRPDLAFSSFGLSTVDPNAGTLTLSPGTGFNGAFLSPDVADVVLRAVSNHSRAKVVSAPRILVNDNATGTLASVNESHYTSINASSTVSTTSFAGYASAGTTISVTPHISEGDHLQIEYQITLSSFTGAAATNAPPPRQTNTVQSKVTIPDGGTIVVGGLNRMDQSSTVTGIPVLDQVPILNLLSSNRTDNKSISSLFVFIRPIVLRDDEFEDLKYLSARDSSTMSIPRDEPASEPMTMP